MTVRRALELRQLILEKHSLLHQVKRQDAILSELEKRHPGITKLERDKNGYILLKWTSCLLKLKAGQMCQLFLRNSRLAGLVLQRNPWKKLKLWMNDKVEGLIIYNRLRLFLAPNKGLLHFYKFFMLCLPVLTNQSRRCLLDRFREAFRIWTGLPPSSCCDPEQPLQSQPHKHGGRMRPHIKPQPGQGPWKCAAEKRWSKSAQKKRCEHLTNIHGQQKRFVWKDRNAFKRARPSSPCRNQTPYRTTGSRLGKTAHSL